MNPNRPAINTLLILIALLSLTTHTRAQVGEQRYQMSVGAHAGINLCSISLSPSIRQGTLQTLTGGIVVRYVSEKYFNMICGAQLELNYTQRGWSEHYDDYPSLKYDRTMNYIEIPLMAHLAFGNEHGLMGFVHLGPYAAFFLSDSYTQDGSWSNYSLNTDQHTQDVENRFDYGLAGGGGIELNTRIGRFQLEGRYYYGLSDFFSCTKKDDFSRAAHSIITIRVGYLFDL